MSTAFGADDSAEEVAADCPYINQYCRDRHDGVVRCTWLKEKGRILLSTRAFNAGQVIFREPPLHIVAEQAGNPLFDRVKDLCKTQPRVFEYDPLWYWTALCSLKSSQIPQGRPLKAVSDSQHRQLLLLYHPPVSEASRACKALVQELELSPQTDPVELERLLQVWILNCFEHSDDPLGYSTYFMSSFMSHSCLPNAVWHYEGNFFILRARSDIRDGDEIAVSYLSEDALLESTASRQSHLLESKHFQCTCARCMSGRDLSRGFRCPRCSGIMYHTGFEEKPGPSALCPCTGCGQTCDPSEFERWAKQENRFKELLEKAERCLEQSPARRAELGKVVEVALAEAETTMAQHWLIDRSWQFLANVFTFTRRAREAECLVRKRIDFQEKAYPHLSGSRAWTLESYADMLLRHKGATVDPKVQIPSETVAKALVATAPKIYEEALITLKLLFGNRHDYFSAVHRKSAELDAELARFGFIP